VSAGETETILYLVRHGATAHNEQRPVILQGNGVDGPLSENGQCQAAAVAGFLARFPLARVYASPMRRARETAEHIAGRHDLQVETIDQVHEVDVGEWEGRTWSEIMAADQPYYDRFMENAADVPYLGGETYRDVLARVQPALERVLERHAGESIAVVAHNVVNRVFLGSLLGLDLSQSRQIRQTNCCVNVVRRKDGKTELVTLNLEFHLGVR